MPQSSDLSIVLQFLRRGEGWSQTRLAEAAGVLPSLINDYENARKPLTRGRVEYLIGLLGLPPETIDDTLDCLAANRAAARAPGAPADRFVQTRRHIASLSAQVGRLASGFCRSLLTLLTVEGEALYSRQLAETQLARLKRRPFAERRLFVAESREFRNWALCERMCAESVALAPNHPQEARQWAELAVLLAPLLPGEQAWRWRVEGYCLAFLGNAERACNDLQAAERALARARKLWESGAPGDPGLLNEAWLPWIEAVLRRCKRRFAEALQKIDEALDLDRGELRGQILVSKARIHETLGDPEASTAALLEAEPLIDVHKEPRLAFGVRFNLLLDLCALDRAAEAAPRLPEIRALAESLGEELDLHRVLWLEGKAGAGLGRTADALAAFAQVQSEFRTRELPLEYASVSLDLALVLLKLGRLAEVRTTAEEMLAIFKAQGVHREALVALQVFFEAASREAATVELIRRVASFLQRVQLDPELRFEDEGAEAP